MFNPIKLIGGLITKGARSQALAKVLGWIWAGSEIVQSNGIRDADSLLAALKALGMGWLASLMLDKWQAQKAADNEAKMAIARSELAKAGMPIDSIATMIRDMPSGRVSEKHYPN